MYRASIETSWNPRIRITACKSCVGLIIKVEVAITCPNNINHTLRVYLPPDFPNSCPSMVVISPSGLLQRKNGSLMNSMSGADHTLSSKDGYTQICHFLPSSWNGNNTLYQVIMKGRVWLEAYEVHLETQ